MLATAHMAVRTETLPRSTLVTNESMGPRIVPIPTPTIKMSPPVSGDPMEITSPTNTSTSANNHGSDSDTNPNTASNGKTPDRDRPKNSPVPDQSNNSNNMPAPPPAAAAAVHQPKIVQTAFIHKLYNMLEDPNIQHLISWSASAESFVMSPSADFSKVLSQYFKHTNISSFVRQLNMYGFHKERDVFHTGNPDTTLWEFKHGNGNFKRGDLVGLREIKRRASRHALVHRESNFSKPVTSQPGTPAEPVPLPPDSTGDGRLASIEYTLHDLSGRLQRSEENSHYMNIKNQATMETMNRLLHFNQELSRTVLSLVPAESPVSRDVMALQGEMQRQAEMLRSLDEPQESPYSSRQQYFSGIDNGPVSPRQLAQDDQRRSANLTVPQPRAQQNFYRPPVPSNLSISTRRPYGSISGSSTTQSSPLRTVPPPPPPQPHPLSNVEHPGSLARRHTAADIRAHGWQPTPSPFGPGASAAQWPPSPNRVAPEDQRIRESLSTYSLSTATHAQPNSRPTTPPPPFANGAGNSSEPFGNWSWGGAGGRENKNLSVKDHSAPPTRRGSMAHILNPSDTAERSDEDEDPRGDDDRKRKRMQ
ncbi:Fc.00g029350.m01.CDS01 [Cosmosporella sp. VM-42]